MPLSNTTKGALIGGGVGAGAGLLLGGGTGALIGGLGGAGLGALLGGKKNPNPHVPETVAGQPTPNELYDFLALLRDDDETYAYLHAEEAVPPRVFFPAHVYEFITDRRGTKSRYRPRGLFLQTDIITMIGLYLGNYWLKLKYTNMIEYVLLKLELWLENHATNENLLRIIESIPVKVREKGLTLYRELEVAILTAFCNYLLETKEVSDDIITYRDVIGGLYHNPYLQILGPLFEQLEK